MLHGEPVKLYHKKVVGTDGIGAPVYDWYDSYTVVDNVLIGEPAPEERLNEFHLTGRMIAYTLGIPKGDTNAWENEIVEFFGHKFKTFGIPVVGIEANIPLQWHKKVQCARYE